MKKKSILLTLFSLLILVSCSKEDFQNSQEPVNLQERVLKFVFEDKEYSSIVYDINDSTMKFEDKNVEKVYNSLQELPNLAVYLDEEGTEYCYKNEEELDAHFGFESQTISNRSYTPTPPFYPRNYALYYLRFHFFAGDNLTGTKAPFEYEVAYNTIAEDRTKYDLTRYVISKTQTAVPDLGVWNFNDVLCSFYITSVYPGRDILYPKSMRIRFYQDTKFNGACITFPVYGVPINLNQYKFKKNTWARRASSFRILADY